MWFSIGATLFYNAKIVLFCQPFELFSCKKSKIDVHAMLN